MIIGTTQGHCTRALSKSTTQEDRIKELHKGTMKQEDHTRGPHKTKGPHKEITQGNCTRVSQKGVAERHRRKTPHKGTA